jgi:hypothetical protein
MLNCLICQSPLEPGEATADCPACQAHYHRDCWEENRGCAVYGCSRVPETDKLDSVEVPTGYWGQENKPCPACGQQILAVARRCRHCGTTFDNARPEDSAEFRQKMALRRQRSTAQSTVMVCFALCLLPCTAPLGALLTIAWSSSARAQVKDLPALYGGLVKLGILVAALETLFIVGILMLHSVRH